MLPIVGERGLPARSAGGGETWEMLVSPYTGSFFGAIPDGQGGAVVYGMRGRLYKIPDVASVETQSPMDYDPFMAANVEESEAIRAMGWERLETPTNESFFGASTMPVGSITFGGNGWVMSRGES